MLSTRAVNRFNEVRALIYCGSPQVRERDGYIETLDENGDVDSDSIKLAFPGAYNELRRTIRENPLSITAVEWHSLVVIRDRKGLDLAYMLP